MLDVETVKENPTDGFDFFQSLMYDIKKLSDQKQSGMCDILPAENEQIAEHQEKNAQDYCDQILEEAN